MAREHQFMSLRDFWEPAEDSACALAKTVKVVRTNTEGYKQEPEVDGKQALQG